MQVILRKDVQNVGEAGDVVNVKDGYARNFLIPQNFAEIATDGALKNREQNLARIKAKQEKLHQEALELSKKIEELGSLELSAKAGESGKLFGTITLDAAINKLGEYRMLIKLTSKVKTELPVIVTASEILQSEIEETPETEEAAE